MSEEQSASLRMPRFTVKLATMSEPLDITVPNSAQVDWEIERSAKKYPDASDAPTLWSSFVSWSAAKRAGQIDPVMPYEAFRESLESIEFRTPDVADPTNPDQEEG